MFLLKFIGYFCVSFIILSIPVQNGTLYSKLYQETKPTTDKILNQTADFGGEILKSSKELVSKIFKNIVPNRDKMDRVRSSRSAVKKEVEQGKSEPEDNYTREEQRLLEKILRETHY